MNPLPRYLLAVLCLCLARIPSANAQGGGKTVDGMEIFSMASFLLRSLENKPTNRIGLCPTADSSIMEHIILWFPSPMRTPESASSMQA